MHLNDKALTTLIESSRVGREISMAIISQRLSPLASSLGKYDVPVRIWIKGYHTDFVPKLDLSFER